MASLGQLVIELAANSARMQSDLGKAVGIAERAAGKLKSAFKFAGGGLLGAAIINVAKQSIEFGDSINKAAIKAGIGGKAMSELAYAAKLADVDMASLSTALKKMQVSLSEAGTGAKAPILALSALGLTIAEVQKRKPAAQFELLADRISKLTDPADRARAAVELFGKAGADLLPLFEQGAAGIAKARAEAEKLGLSFGDDQIKALSEADDSLKRFDASWKGLAATITALVAGPLAQFFDMLSGLDTRGINKQISDLESRIKGASGFRGPQGAELRRQAVAELEALKGRRDLLEMQGLQTGTSGGGRGRSSFAIGHGAADAAAKATEAAKKEMEKQAKFRKELIDADKAAQKDLMRELTQENDEKYDRELQRALDNEDQIREAQKESAALAARWHEDEDARIQKNIEIFRDGFLNAWDDMVNNGKFKIDELFKYIIAEFARRGIVKLFDSIFSGKSGTSSSGGWINAGLSALGSLFGGGRASGGPVQAGKVYRVNENTPNSELFAPGVNGSVLRNGGGAPVINVNTNIDARGATMELAKALPRILEQNRKATIAEIVEGLRRDKYAL